MKMKIDKFEQSKISVVEIFSSISGEGISSGEVVSFVRVAGCNLRCHYCDTQYSYDEIGGEKRYLTPKEIVDEFQELGCEKIICTGGEPLELGKAKRLLPLYLAAKGFDVRIETNGACPLYRPNELVQMGVDEDELTLHYTMDVKSPSSGMSAHNIIEENFEQLSKGDEVKFVVGSEEDIAYAMDVIHSQMETLAQHEVILNFSPVFGQMEPARLVDFMKDQNRFFQNYHLQVRLSLQIHKYIWPPEARGV